MTQLRENPVLSVCRALFECVSMVSPHTATHCNTLQHTATHCNTLQHTATHVGTCDCVRMRLKMPEVTTLSPHTATHCNTLQHTATHCNTLQNIATHCNTHTCGCVRMRLRMPEVTTLSPSYDDTCCSIAIRASSASPDTCQMRPIDEPKETYRYVKRDLYVQQQHSTRHHTTTRAAPSPSVLPLHHQTCVKWDL